MKIAVVQMDVHLGNVERNLNTMLDHVRLTNANGARLAIFPECALTGYCFESLEEARTFAQPVPGPATERFQAELNQLGSYAVFGMLEETEHGIYNVAVLMGPEGVIGKYRKIHLPCLGVDAFVTYGDEPFAVYDLEDIRIGLGICYDSAFPESARVMALQGADLIALPTNFPSGAASMVEFAIRTRAMENNIYFAACNRIGDERGFRFIGQSQIADPTGFWLAHANPDSPEILYAEIDPAFARQKHVVRVPGKHSIDRIADRRPEMYGLITQPHSLPRPGREKQR
ncbi:carbon-nitrogen hydrolase family protein [Planctomicrobium sp. SH661]|uniref:carbon-nitrogen hydrolase family protein n=1 Tax=Planctomicrobium sp. SH661 TaxID=3448124 RepID=UPI003F5C5F87